MHNNIIQAIEEARHFRNETGACMATNVMKAKGAMKRLGEELYTC